MRYKPRHVLAGVTILLGLALVPTTTANAATTSCSQMQSTVNQLENQLAHVTDPAARQRLEDKIDALLTRMENQGCFNTTTRTFSATATIWTDSDHAPGPYVQNLSFAVTISNTGAVSWTLPTTAFPGGVTISQRSGQFASGSYGTGGYLALTAPIAVDTPSGSATGTLDISTDQTMNTRDGSRSGSRLSSPDAKSGAVTLVGTTPLTISVVSLTAQIQISGTLS